MATMYELQGKYHELYELAEDGTIDPALLHDTMDSITDAIEDKAVGYVQVIKQVEADADEIDAEIKRLTERKNSYTRNAKTLKQVLVGAMNDVDAKKFKTPLYTIWVQQSASVALESDDPMKLPVQYVKAATTYKVDKKGIAADLKAGKEVKGAKLVYSDSLRVR